MIGAGLFVGSGAVTNQTGPAAILPTSRAGVLVVLIMRMLGEMAVANPHHQPHGARRLLPRGRHHGAVSGIVVVIFAFVGSEIVTIAAAESDETECAVAKATNAVIYRVLVFYVVAVFVVVAIVPWNDTRRALFCSVLIALAELRMRHALERESPDRLTLKMWGFPWVTYFAIAGTVAVIVAMAFVEEVRAQLWWSLASLAVVLVAAWWRYRRSDAPASIPTCGPRSPRG